MENNNSIIWSSPKHGAPIVRVTEYGIIFNGATISLLNEPKGIKMGYNIENQSLIVKPVKNIDETKDQNIYEFADRNREGSSIRIGNKNFIKYISSQLGRDLTDEINKFPASWNEDDNCLKVDLNKPFNSIKEDNEDNGNDEAENAKTSTK